MANLTRSEVSELAECEAVIERGLYSVAEMGNALRKVRDKRLYRETYATFNDYCLERWHMGESYVNHQIRAAKVIENLGTIVPKPNLESQARPLSQLEPEERREAWSLAVENAGNGHPTAAQVKAAVDEIVPKPLTEAKMNYAQSWIDIVEKMCISFTSFNRRGGARVLPRIGHKKDDKALSICSSISLMRPKP